MFVLKSTGLLLVIIPRAIQRNNFLRSICILLGTPRSPELTSRTHEVTHSTPPFYESGLSTDFWGSLGGFSRRNDCVLKTVEVFLSSL